MAAAAQVLPSDQLAVLGMINMTDTTSTRSSGWVSMDKWGAVLAIVWAGDMPNQDIDAKLEQAQDASGTGAKDISGKAIATVANKDNKTWLIAASIAELDTANGFDHVRITIEPEAGIAWDHGALLLGGQGRHMPASDFNSSHVQELVI